MRTQVLTLKRLIGLLRFYRWYLVTTYCFLSFLMVALVLNTDVFKFRFVDSLDLTVFLIMTIFIVGMMLIFLVPPLLVIWNLEILVTRYSAGPQYDRGLQPESRRLTRLLLFIFAINFLGMIGNSFRSPRIDFAEMLSKISSPYLQRFMQSILDGHGLPHFFERLMAWLTISFDGIMPLVYLGAGFLCVQFDRYNKRLKAELDEVI